MSTGSVWFIPIDKKGKKGRPSRVPPKWTSRSQPRVTTILVLNWDSNDHQVEVILDPGQSGDILIDVPKM